MQPITPIVLFFIVVIIGLMVGRIKFFNVSLDVSSVLIISIIAGYLISLFQPETVTADFQNSMQLFSKTGTALFVASVGLAAGVSITHGIEKKTVLYLSTGSLMVISGFIAMELIQFADATIDSSLLYGILCGALTSTPGLSSACDSTKIIADNAVLGYGCAYPFGVIGVVLFMQLCNKTDKYIIEEKNIDVSSTTPANALILIGISVVIGNIAGVLKIPFINKSLGVSCGILCISIITGVISKIINKSSKFNNVLSIYRNLGLLLFFVGTGIPAGINLNSKFELKWFLYGVILTVIPIAVGYILVRYVCKQSTEDSLCVVAGGMTSTPAICVLLKRMEHKPNMTAYLSSYVSALLTMVIGMSIIT